MGLLDPTYGAKLTIGYRGKVSRYLICIIIDQIEISLIISNICTVTVPAPNRITSTHFSFGGPETIECVIEGRKEGSFQIYIETFWSR